MVNLKKLSKPPRRTKREGKRLDSKVGEVQNLSSDVEVELPARSKRNGRKQSRRRNW
jgi:hypothetical protein